LFWCGLRSFRTDGREVVIVLGGQDVVVKVRRVGGRDVVRPSRQDKQDQ
jgi:hypothetical protein